MNLSINTNLVDIKPLLNKITNNELLTTTEAQSLINAICFVVRTSVDEDINSFYINKCDEVANIICDYLNTLGIINIHQTTQELINKETTNIPLTDVEGHDFVVALINTIAGEQLFLIDPTFKQFMVPEEIKKDYYILHENKVLRSPKPGYFIKEEDEQIFSELIYNGNIPLDKSISDKYLNLFLHTARGININDTYNLPSDTTFSMLTDKLLANTYKHVK